MIWNGTELVDAGIDLAADILINDISKLYGPWIAISTYGNGLVLLCTATESLRHISTENGLTSDLVRAISFDPEGILWIGTNSGLNRIELDITKTLSEQFDHLPIITYTSSDGLLTEQINGVEGLSNQVWMSGNNGITVLRADYLGHGSMTIPLIIESVNINNQKQPIVKEYRVPYSQNQVDITFTGIFLRDAPRLLYKYRMVELNTEWTVTNNNFINFQYLPSGKYTFEVAAFTLDNRVRSETTTLTIYISPPFWKSPIFIVLIALAIGLTLYSLLKWRIAYVRTEERKMRLSEERIIELEHQALQAMIKPHTVFNLINSIRYYVVNKESEKASELLLKFAKLVRIHLDSTYKRLIKISEEIDRLRLFIELESERLEYGIFFEHKINPHIDVNRSEIPSLILHPFIENTIVHGISPKVYFGLIELIIDIDQDRQFNIEIIDNGIGLVNNAEFRAGTDTDDHINTMNFPFRSKKTNSEFDRTSLGLQLVIERVRLISRENGLKWSILVKNIFNDDGTVAGVSVKITLPVKAVITD